MNLLRLFASLALALPAVPGFAAEAPSPSRIANDFYAVYSTFHPSDGIPDAAGRAKYAPFISPAFEKLLAEAAAAEVRFAKTNKDSPPLIEGDLFTSMFEGATAYKIGVCKEEGANASCAVDLTYDDKKDAPVHWSDTVTLKKTNLGWRVDDIGYGASWAFANKGHLTAVLRQTIADSGG
jgi:hypothetical protein